MKKKQLISLFLVALMLVSMLAGCGQKETKESKETASQSTETSKTEEASQSTEQEVPKEPPTKLTFGSSYTMQTDPVPWYETPIVKKILEEANVEIEYVQYDTEQFKLLLASGDLPDVVFTTAKRTDDIIAGELALDMGPLLEEYAPNMLTEQYTARNALMRRMYGGDEGAFYFVGSLVNTEGTSDKLELTDGYNLRWDYYLEVGAPEITDDDSYVDVIEKMVAAHPTNEKGEKTYGMGLYDAFSNWWTRGAFTSEASTVKAGIDNTMYVADLSTDELVNGFTDTDRAAFWIDMRFYNKLWNKGLLDPDSFTMTADQYAARLEGGRYVAAISKDTTLYKAEQAKNPDTLAGIVNIPTEAAVINSGSKSLLGNFPYYCMFISAKTEKKEAAMRLLNVLHDPDIQRMVWSGMEGETWNYVNGVPTFTDEMIEMVASSDTKLLEYGVMKKNAPLAILQNSSLHPDGYPVYLAMVDDVKASTLNTLQKSVADHYGVEYPLQAAEKLVAEGKTIDKRDNYSTLISGILIDPSTDMDRIGQKCKDILYKAVPELVMAASEAEFKEVQTRVLKEIADTGEAEVWAWYLEQWKVAKKEIQALIN